MTRSPTVTDCSRLDDGFAHTGPARSTGIAAGQTITRTAVESKARRRNTQLL
jgi:hypothetical protein